MDSDYLLGTYIQRIIKFKLRLSGLKLSLFIAHNIFAEASWIRS